MYDAESLNQVALASGVKACVDAVRSARQRLADAIEQAAVHNRAPPRNGYLSLISQPAADSGDVIVLFVVWTRETHERPTCHLRLPEQGSVCTSVRRPRGDVHECVYINFLSPSGHGGGGRSSETRCPHGYSCTASMKRPERTVVRSTWMRARSVHGCGPRMRASMPRVASAEGWSRLASLCTNARTCTGVCNARCFGTRSACAGRRARSACATQSATPLSFAPSARTWVNGPLREPGALSIPNQACLSEQHLTTPISS